MVLCRENCSGMGLSVPAARGAVVITCPLAGADRRPTAQQNFLY
jgi:hypothetical protein